MSLESNFAVKVDDWLESMGAHAYNINLLSQIGVPDRMGLIDGLFFALEIKKSGDELNKKNSTIALQRYNLGKIQNHGGFAAFIYPENFEYVKERFVKWVSEKRCR